jgi:gamma-glutamyltranspeptidase / glutathione hydrolase
MRGAIAAGHPLTAEAGARVLRAGGNAVDACVAAALVSWVSESPLTGPGGGGFMLLHDATDGRTRVLDFFVAVPRDPAGEGELLELEVDFDGDTQQRFRTGAAAVGVPGTALGLEEAHRRFGSLPWPGLVAPAATLARDGIVLTPAQGYLHRILDGLLRHSPEGDAMYGPGRPLAAGERFAVPGLADTLERMAAEGAGCLYRGELAERLVAHVRAGGGALSLDDLAAYRVVRRRPLAVEYRGHEFRTNPPPSSGGLLVALGLRALGDSEPDPEAVAAAMDAQESARGPAFVRRLHRGGAAVRLLSGTTHISVVDGRGDAASLSTSLGSGSGVVVPGTGIHLNNMLGEADLTEHARPGERLTSMMAPSLVLRGGRPRLVLGSAGSARLRGAILQVAANVVGRGMGVREAVEAPRLHVEDGVAHCEDPAVADLLERAGYPVVRFRRRNLYFGGVSAVELRSDGTLAAAGDPRRGGRGVVVDA